MSVAHSEEALRRAAAGSDKLAAALELLDLARMERDDVRKLLVEALIEWEYAAKYKGDYLAKKHGDDERIAEMRKLIGEVPAEVAT